MLRRAELASGRRSARVWGGTFHAVGNRLLRVHGRALGLAPDFTVMDQADSADMMNLIRGELGLGTRDRRFPRKETLATIYSRVVNAGTPLGPVLDRYFPWCWQEADPIADVAACPCTVVSPSREGSPSWGVHRGPFPPLSETLRAIACDMQGAMRWKRRYHICRGIRQAKKRHGSEFFS